MEGIPVLGVMAPPSTNHRSTGSDITSTTDSDMSGLLRAGRVNTSDICSLVQFDKQLRRQEEDKMDEGRQTADEQSSLEEQTQLSDTHSLSAKEPRTMLESPDKLQCKETQQASPNETHNLEVSERNDVQAILVGFQKLSLAWKRANAVKAEDERKISCLNNEIARYKHNLEQVEEELRSCMVLISKLECNLAELPGIKVMVVELKDKEARIQKLLSQREMELAEMKSSTQDQITRLTEEQERERGEQRDASVKKLRELEQQHEHKIRILNEEVQQRLARERDCNLQKIVALEAELKKVRAEWMADALKFKESIIQERRRSTTINRPAAKANPTGYPMNPENVLPPEYNTGTNRVPANEYTIGTNRVPADEYTIGTNRAPANNNGTFPAPSNYVGAAPANYSGAASANYPGAAPNNYTGATPTNYTGATPVNYPGASPSNHLSAFSRAPIRAREPSPYPNEEMSERRAGSFHQSTGFKENSLGRFGNYTPEARHPPSFNNNALDKSEVNHGTPRYENSWKGNESFKRNCSETLESSYMGRRGTGSMERRETGILEWRETEKMDRRETGVIGRRPLPSTPAKVANMLNNSLTKSVLKNSSSASKPKRKVSFNLPSQAEEELNTKVKYGPMSAKKPRLEPQPETNDISSSIDVGFEEEEEEGMFASALKLFGETPVKKEPKSEKNVGQNRSMAQGRAGGVAGRENNKPGGLAYMNPPPYSRFGQGPPGNAHGSSSNTSNMDNGNVRASANPAPANLREVHRFETRERYEFSETKVFAGRVEEGAAGDKQRKQPLAAGGSERRKFVFKPNDQKKGQNRANKRKLYNEPLGPVEL